MLRILIVEDHKVLASGLERFLDLHFAETTISIVSTGRECLTILNKEDFDIILLDINLPDINGTDLCRFIINARPSAKIMAITGRIEKSIFNKMFEAGASGYILKTSIADELIKGIETVMAGGIFISADLR